MTIIAQKPLDERLVDTLLDLCNAVPALARYAKQSNNANSTRLVRADLARLVHRARQVADFAEGELVKLGTED
jgi:hypothetical protein